MKTDTTYSAIDVCPETNNRMSDSEINNSGGVCPYCGDITTYSYAHSKKISGRFVRPSMIERIFQGKRTTFIRKIDEDKIMDMLKL